MNALLKNLLLVSAAIVGVPSGFSEPAKPAPAKPVPARSVFVMPTNLREGRDPFYPESLRPFEDAVATKHAVDINAFSVKGISIVRGRAMAIINNHTFAVGDEGDVLTASGRVHLRCAEIRANTVVIEANGSKHELTLGTK